MEELKEITSEQKKSISKILLKARLNLFFIGLKFSVGLFGANLICILLGNQILKDITPEFQIGFQIVSMTVNFIFMARYLDSKIKENSDIVSNQVKEVLKK